MAAKPDPDAMETTPAPEEPRPTPATNGVNGKHGKGSEEEDRPKPPPHRTPTSPPAKPAIRPEDAEAFKAAGNKFYKAGQYGSAIDEYTKGKEHSIEYISDDSS
jgi:DnaJ family protein C protein 7